MKTRPVVSEAAAQLARDIENKMASLSKDAGVLFVSTETYAQEDGPEFSLFVGCGRNMDPRTVKSLVLMTLGDMVASNKLLLTVRRGVLGATAK
jgi:hypothetical protein